MKLTTAKETIGKRGRGREKERENEKGRSEERQRKTWGCIEKTTTKREKRQKEKEV
jgi:hypothetical protein